MVHSSPGTSSRSGGGGSSNDVKMRNGGGGEHHDRRSGTSSTSRSSSSRKVSSSSRRLKEQQQQQQQRDASVRSIYSNTSSSQDYNYHSSHDNNTPYEDPYHHHVHNYASYVYVHDEAYSWLPGKIVSQEDSSGTATVQIMKPPNWTETTIFSSPQTPARFASAGGGKKGTTTTTTFDNDDMDGKVVEIKLSDYPNGELPLQNISKLLSDGTVQITVKPDMADLPFLHEASVLYNVKELYCRVIDDKLPEDQQCIPYSRVGDIIIALNPFRWMNHLYSEKMQLTYADRLVWSPSAAACSDEHETTILEEDTTASNNDNTKSSSYSFFLKAGYQPHVYETSSLAYRALSLHAKHQTILVSGESGAGKTETVKIVMNHLAKIQSTKQDALEEALKGSTSQIVERVLESNPLFEAFGNAKTVRNDNSSRFGKFTSLIFHIVGGGSSSSGSSPSRKGSNRRRLSHDEDYDSLQSSKHSLMSGAGGRTSDDEDDTISFDSSESPRLRNSGGAEGGAGGSNSMPYGILVGSSTETYLLEKSRVVAHGPNERTYHIFYQLLAAPTDTKHEIWSEGLTDKVFDDFKYVGHKDTHATEQTHYDDRTGFDSTVIDLSIFGIVGDAFVELMRSLCIVLQLGNITFGQPPNDEMDHDTSVVTSTDELLKLSRLMGVDAEHLTQALVTRNMEARGERFAVSLNPSSAKDGCDALAKELYAQIFDYLVKVINRATKVEDHLTSDESRKGLGSKKPRLAKISILDLFGFESFEVNRFEQLCINYANEKLQQKYVMDNFRLVQDEYIEEGIELFDLSKVDNAAVLDLLEGRMGVIMTLNDECIRPNGSAPSYVYKLKTIHRDNSLILSQRLHRPEEFGIQHFAGPITYDATNFVERNNDTIPPDLIRLCATQCSNDLVRRQFQTLLDETESKRAASSSSSRGAPRRSMGGANAKKTVAAKFRLQLEELMKQIHQSRTRYIRCIRPNRDMAPGLLDQNSTIRQLASAGLVTAITISRETFPDRLEYETLYERFHVLVASSLKQTKLNMKIRVEEILQSLMRGFGYNAMGSVKTPYALGKTKVYFRTGALEYIESKRERYYGTRAIVIQTFVRAKLSRWRFVQLKQGCIYIQSRVHATIARRAYLHLRHAVIVLQSILRTRIQMAEYDYLRRTNACILIQATYRGRCHRISMDLWRDAAYTIQHWYRRSKNKTIFNSALAKCVEDARIDVEMKVLERRLAALQSRDKISPEMLTLAADCVKLLEYSRTEMFKLRRINGELKAEESQLKSQNRKLMEYHNSFEAALTVSNRRILQLGQSNTTLVTEVAQQTKRANALERDIRELKEVHESELRQLVEEDNEDLATKDAEITKLKKGIEKLKHLHKKELYKAKKERRKLREKHMTEVEDLKEELRNTQEVHHDYLNKLMDVLENAHTAREQEEIRLKEEYDARLQDKDRYIDKLQNDLLAMRKVVQRAKTRR